MITTLTTTAFKMPLYGISLPLSDRNLSGHKFHKDSDIQDAISLCLEGLYQSVLPSRNPAMDYCCCFLDFEFVSDR